MPDLSVLIPARNEVFLAQTIADVVANLRGDTEVIAVCDGGWPDPPIADHPRVQLIYLPTPIGQRAATNLAARASAARYVMKLDAHCALAEGFDVELVRAGDELGPDVTQIPAMINLHAFNWRCRACGRETYQGPRPERCAADVAHDRELAVMPPACGEAQGFDQVLVWQPRRRRAQGNGSAGAGGFARTEFWRFDQELKFAYKGPVIRGQEQAEIADVMSSVGACFVMRRDRFLELGGLDEDHGSWGAFGTEIACKSWLSGGRQVVNKRTWFAHMFRTNGAFSFPYAIRGADQDYARRYSQNMWYGNLWPGQTRPLSWLLDHFWPIRGWADVKGAERLAFVRARGAAFRASVAPSPASILVPRAERPVAPAVPTKSLVYYSDLRLDPTIARAVQAQLRRAAPGLPIAVVTLQPTDFRGDVNLVLDLERGYLAMFRQILAGLEALDTDVAFLVEHDILYHPSHFAFVPPRRDVFYYNRHTWKVDAETGRALHYRCDQTSGLCADRALLVEHYRRRVKVIEAEGYHRNFGFEPGTNRWSRALDPHGADHWFSPQPNIDIRHGRNLTPSRWRQDQFRNRRTCQGWTESDEVPGWGRTRGRFAELLATILETPAAQGSIDDVASHGQEEEPSHV